MDEQRMNKRQTEESARFKASQPTSGKILEPLSNEELAVMTHSGSRDAAAQLWEQVKRLVFLLAFKFFNAQRPACASCGVEIEDVQQEAFLAVMDAVEDFSPVKGYKFNTYLRFHTKNRFNALIGYQGNRAPRPLDQAASLDEAAAGEDDVLPLLELVEDPTAAGAFEDAEEREYTKQLHEALQKAMDTLDKQQGEVLRARYYDGLTLKSYAQKVDETPERIRQIEAKALRNMRNGKRVGLLRPFMLEIMSAKAYHGTGFYLWSQKGSNEERIIEYIEELEQRLQRNM